MNYNRITLLLMMDQHAVHERIRYENLLIGNYQLIILQLENIKIYFT